MSNGLIFLLIGPSGSGKSSIIQSTFNDVPNVRRYTTYTTRLPRPGEINGREYYFVDRDEFERLRTQNKLIESQEFYGHLYGSSKEQLEEFIHNGIDGIAAYDVLGSKELLAEYPNNVVTIFIVPPSVEALRRRLLERYGDSTPEGQLRLRRFDMEMEYTGQFKYIVQNINLEQAIINVESIIYAERCARLAREYKSITLPLDA